MEQHVKQQLNRLVPSGTNIYDVLEKRGYLAQSTDHDRVREILGTPGVRFYIGFDPTADSLHVGHFIQMMILALLQHAGHIPYALMGGGTGMVGDPSGRTDLRTMMTPETIQHNIDSFVEQMDLIVDFEDGRGFIVNNADWLLALNYVEFLREIGVHFSVNRMLTAEAYKQRMEKGLTFLEFNYMLMQAYDFLVLHRKHDISLQLGGDDQWSNILAGTDLIRRKESAEAHALTTKLLTNAQGEKMGKTAGGAVWLSKDKFPVFEFYQYWRNVDDADVINCLNLLTFVSGEEIAEYAKLEGQELNEAKKRLAFETTAIVHGVAEAKAAEQQAKDLFERGGRSDQMDTRAISRAELEAGVNLLDILTEIGLIPSKSEGRRLLKQGGIKLNEESVQDPNYSLQGSDFENGEAIVRRGKKHHYRFVMEG